MRDVTNDSENDDLATPTAADKVMAIDTSTTPHSLKEAYFGVFGLPLYKIAVTVASNNITVAIKHLDDTDPSASKPLYMKVGSSIRSITAALSVTKNAATNWCNAGSAELATKLINYFVYLGYNATDGVVVGFSRIPYARFYSDFSTTTTNEKYCAISTITTAASTDDYVNIGRFSATLSAGAGYTWSVSGTGDVINRPIYETDLLTYTVTPTAGAGTPTTVSDTAKYRIRERQLYIKHTIQVTDKGTASGAMSIVYPLTLSATESMTGAEYFAAGYLTMGLSPSTTAMNLWKYDLTTLWTTGHRFVFSGWFEIP